ncbi:M23 family metallopeptidase [Streptomyces sp. NPDC006530]|uniref:M23 family metallopeptidase n=1 Tax=Streptomyces sp. NPDC006530 TaxID=3364750 RepID=UPI0036AB2137
MTSISQPDRAGAARALERFLLADPQRWPELAPDVVAAVGQERLHRILAATSERVGGFTGVAESPEGLLIEGPAGRVLAFARVDSAGNLVGLLVAPGLHRRPRLRIPLRPGARGALACAASCVVLTVRVVACWRVLSMTAWCTDVSVVSIGYLLWKGVCAPARVARWCRGAVEAAALVTLASAWRVPGLPFGHPDLSFVTGLVLLVACAGYLMRARRHRWGAPLSAPLEFPLREGTWLVLQGGGSGLNHHASHPEQRGALDVVGTGASGSRVGRGAAPEAYRIYGAKLYAPCDGQVVAAVDGYADQVPGTIRYEPPYGNHVFIDTGSEVVKLAHLRPGSVTVSTGDRVRAGQPIGEVGNSGNTTEPHLHIHAERDGLGLDLRFTGVPGTLHRGRTLRT